MNSKEISSRYEQRELKVWKQGELQEFKRREYGASEDTTFFV
jgi:hypothetical protein